MHTPTTPEGLEKYDHLPWHEAVRRACTEPGDHPAWHRDRQAELEKAMPLVARALNRGAAEAPRKRRIPWQEPEDEG